MSNEATQDVTVGTQAGTRPGVTILKVSGPLTIRNFFEFQDLTRRQESPVLLIDMTEVPYLDSAALGCILGLYVSCGRHNRKCALTNVTERLKTMFRVCGVQDVIVTFPSIAEAEATLA